MHQSLLSGFPLRYSTIAASYYKYTTTAPLAAKFDIIALVAFGSRSPSVRGKQALGGTDTDLYLFRVGEKYARLTPGILHELRQTYIPVEDLYQNGPESGTCTGTS